MRPGSVRERAQDPGCRPHNDGDLVLEQYEEQKICASGPPSQTRGPQEPPCSNFVIIVVSLLWGRFLFSSDEWFTQLTWYFVL